MIRKLSVLFGLVLASMLVVTTWASLHENVIDAVVRLAADPWGLATLFDAYFGFLTFYAWVWYKEPCTGARVTWFISIMVLGNIAMSFFVLRELYRLKPGAGPADLLLRRDA